MKKFPIFVLLMACATVFNVSAKDILVDGTMSLKTAIMTSASGDRVILTEGVVYPCGSIINTIATRDLTVMADAGLAIKPTMQFEAASDQLAWDIPAGMKLTLDGIVLDANHTTTFYILASTGGATSITANNCDFINITNAAGTSGAVVVSKTLPITGDLTFTNCTFTDVKQSIYLGTSGCFKNVKISNCLIKGAALQSTIYNTTTKPDSYIIDHVTFDGLNYRELSTTSNLTTTITNCLFANDAYTAKGLQPGTVTTQSHLAFFNYMPGLSTLVASVTSDPVMVNGIATSADYVNKGSDLKTIGYYGNSTIYIPASVKTLKALSPITVAQNGNVFTLKGATDAAYSVYSVSGSQVSNGQVINNTIEMNLNQGIYLLKTNGYITKFSVR